MRSTSPLLLSALSLALLVAACFGSDSATGVPGADGLVGLAIQPALIQSAADGDALPINRIRTVTTRVSDNTVLDDKTVQVDPGATSWDLVLRIRDSGDETVVVIFLYLMNASGDGPASVEFSGRSEPITLVAGEVISPDIPFVRGPLANLFVTGVTITSAPAVMEVDDVATLEATAETSGSVDPTLFWTSLDPSVIAITGSTATAVTPGTAELVASAGAHSDTVLVIVRGPLAVTTASLPTGRVDLAYSVTLEAAGGDGSYTWDVTSGSLPAGLSLNASTGEISGTPTAPGSSSFTVQVTSGDQLTASRQLTIDVYDVLTVTTSLLPTGTANAPYSQSLAANGGDGAYTWTIAAGALPDGLSLDASSGAITGAPTTEGLYDFTVQVTSGDGQTAQRDLFIEVIAVGLGQVVGMVFDAVTSKVIPSAGVTLTGGGLSLDATTDANGVYSFTAIPGGTYSVAATATGYVDNTAANLEVVDVGGDVVRADFALPPVGENRRFGGLSGRVLDDLGNPLGGASVSISGGIQTNGIFKSTTAGSDGTYSLVGIVLDDSQGVPIQQFTVIASAAGFKTAQTSVALIQNETVPNVDFSLSPSQGGQVFFQDDFETDPSWTASGFWNWSTLDGRVNLAYPTYVNLAPGDNSGGALPAPVQGSYAFWYGEPFNGNYIGDQDPNDSPGSGGRGIIPNQGDLISPPFTIPANAPNATLRFDTWFEIESVNPNSSGYDLMTIIVKDEGSGVEEALTTLNPYVDPTLEPRDAIPFTSGGFNAVPVWRTEFVDLSSYVGKEVSLIFRFETFDELYNGFRGWLIDDVSVSDVAVPAGAPALAPPGSGSPAPQRTR